MFRLALLSLALVGCAQKSEVDAMDARLKAIEEKVATLEKAPPGKAGAAPAANPEEEEAAGKLMTEVQDSIKLNDYATAKTKLADLTGKYAGTRAGKAAGRMAAEINLIGTDAAPLEMDKWFQGKADLSGSKATLLVFWEVWCPHCKKELPKLAEEEGKYKEMGVQVVGITKVTKSATDEKVEEFIKESKAKFPIGKEKDGNLSKAYSVSGIPAAALLMNGKVIWRGHPARLDDATLAALLAKG
ncbi:MAG: TlpA disulfide reductase family protein [Pseudomonadota bacterium]|nr:TlpA disulfide reductase family protein [Pseudomonadota bacterium]